MRDYRFYKYIFSPTFYPELVGLSICLIFIGGFVDDTVYAWVAFGLALVSFITFCLGFFKFNRNLLDVAVVVMLAIGIGLLQFNYLPTICLWLLLFYRLMIIPINRSIPLALLALVLIGFSLLTIKNVLPELLLESYKQAILNHINVSLTAIIFGFHLWRLLRRTQEYKIRFEQSERKINNLAGITNKLARFTPPQIWQPIIRTNEPLEVRNQRKKLTILFSDIVGFTELSDELSADHLADILNTYFEHMTRITNKYNATLDKFIGDGMLCFFGDKDSEGEKADAIKCANMALEMRQTMQVLRSQWRLLGFEGLYVRIGINTGYCHVGNFGSPQRMAYTVIGRAANLAARLETAAKKNQILLSEATYDLIAANHYCVLAGNYQFKGIKEPVPVWELLNPQDRGQTSNWLNYELPGFNLHLSIDDIKNYDEKQIRKSLIQALEQLEAKKSL